VGAGNSARRQTQLTAAASSHYNSHKFFLSGAQQKLTRLAQVDLSARVVDAHSIDFHATLFD
jgi:hypothetical protein